MTRPMRKICLLMLSVAALSVAALSPLAADAPSEPAARAVAPKRAAPLNAAPDRPVSTFRRPQSAPFPAEAPFDRRIAVLGKMLFFDPRLSGAGSMSCASCHNPSFGWELPTPKDVTGARLARQAPTLLNVAWGEHFFWDGRAPDLESQAIGPITNPLEMGADLDQVVRRLRAIGSYERWFREAFPDTGLTRATLLTAIATFERTIVAGWAPFDAWIVGDDRAISVEAKRGFALFIGRAGCARCHRGWNFTDGQFHDIGLESADPGRSKIVGETDGARRFKTPSLREIEKRAPYMHDGSLDDLANVLDHYTRLTEGRTPDLGPTALSDQEKADIIAFLLTLTSSGAAVAAPVLPVR